MKRKLFDALYAHLEKKPYTILVGARQTGKTTLMKQLAEKAKEDGADVYMFNLERRDVCAAFNESPENLLSFIKASKGRKYVFIDEVQYLEDPSNFIKLIYDEHSEDIKIFATGSSAFYIDKKFNDSLAGRKRVFRLRTCSFEETLELSGQEELLVEYRRITADKNARTAHLAELYNALEDFIIYGGYPAVVFENDKTEKINILQELRDSFLKKDILEAGINNTDGMYRLYIALAAQTGSQVNVSELARTLRISSETVQNYMTVFQRSFHIALIKPFYRNVRKELTRMPKCYVMDTGMRNVMLNYFPQTLGLMDDGALFENYVFHSLNDKYDVDEIKYWRTTDQNEVDFVIDTVKLKAAYEVKFNSAVIKRSKYRMFTDAYSEYPLGFISMKPFSEERLREQQVYT